MFVVQIEQPRITSDLKCPIPYTDLKQGNMTFKMLLVVAGYVTVFVHVLSTVIPILRARLCSVFSYSSHSEITIFHFHRVR